MNSLSFGGSGVNLNSLICRPCAIVLCSCRESQLSHCLEFSAVASTGFLPPPRPPGVLPRISVTGPIIQYSLVSLSKNFSRIFSRFR
jgi:hypothetical protein